MCFGAISSSIKYPTEEHIKKYGINLSIKNIFKKYKSLIVLLNAVKKLHYTLLSFKIFPPQIILNIIKQNSINYNIK
jgi:NO-binding membrane sensor protein with MHYT domain